MNIRRPVTALFVSLALVGGPATLVGCGDPAGLDRNDGEPEQVVETDGSEDDLPDNSNSDPEDGVGDGEEGVQNEDG